MLFCPYCANNLTIGDREDSADKCWICPTCPYQFIIDRQISMRTHLKRKQVDDVLGGKEAWANVDKIDDDACPLDALSYLDGDGDKPARYVIASIIFGATEEPYVQDLVVGPLPVSDDKWLRTLGRILPAS
ncbi:hypothetical protein I350_01702 [Cryptococcus amylolentus CBS 6273]|uniref:DNA-directed RNA polymerase M/15kDa subunit domain-containing protein n=1 Tax=Cryptococcus amylolentus CBS 6273 TaxID=1296118 RepID=A0A1E3KDB8_9TREE|nr:hypothetical protein I350_01702 [Cryptococcus amylolentus CBS 6273]